MIELGYKTNGGLNRPQRKQNVYFCCHEKDFDRLFEEISSEILERQDCTIWYIKDKNEKKDEDFFNQLREMCLFVMPVTTMLLCTDNEVINIEFRFAIENHIPVLPIMTESGLEYLFNKKCGDIQFLDKYSKDMTILNYEDKLTEYLKDVLLGDEILDEIKEAFIAYIFLSYRKIDRKYAQELMKVIHKNNFCQDIAIWYDEFLTIGESFNNNIEKALLNSDFFVLTVTPNLLNKQNYISEIEYPMARKEKKEILPVEAVETDRKELEKHYEDIPACININCEKELKDALLAVVNRLETREIEDLKKHNYLIGLAYLRGVDVEFDYEKALDLITLSAKEGYERAIDTLVSVYWNGIGTARDCTQAINWQTKLVQTLKDKLREEPSEELWQKLIQAHIDCAGFYEKTGDTNLAKQYYLRALSKVREEYVTEDKVIYFCSLIYYGLAQVCMNEGNYDESAFWLEKDINELKLQKIETDGVSEIILAGIYNNLGYLYAQKKNYKEAKRCFENVLSEIANLSNYTEEKFNSRFLILAYNNLGNIHRDTKDFENALIHYDHALNLSKNLVEEMYSTEDEELFLMIYHNLGYLYQINGDKEIAIKYYKDELSLCQKLSEKTGSLEIQKKLSDIYISLGDFMLKNGDIIEAKSHYEMAIFALKEYLKKDEFIIVEKGLQMCYEKLGYLAYMLEDFVTARNHYKRCLELSEKLAERTGTVLEKTNLLLAYINWTNILMDINKKEAKEQLKIAMELAWNLFVTNPTNQSRIDYCRCNNMMGDLVLEEINGKLKAFHYYKKILEMSSLPVGDDVNPEIMDMRGISCYKCGIIDVLHKRKYLEMAKSIYQKLVRDYPQTDRYKQILDIIEDELK